MNIRALRGVYLSLMLCTLHGRLDAHELEIRVEPSEVIYVNQTARLYGTYDIMVQTIAVINRSPAPVEFEELTLSAGDSTITIATDHVLRKLYERRWSSLFDYFSDPAVREAQDSIHLLSRVLPEGVSLSPSVTLQPNTAIVVTNRALVFSGYVVPNLLRIDVRATNAEGDAIEARVTRRVERYPQKNEYIFPVKGRWYLASSSSLRSHHRIRLGHEFALDLIKIGDRAGGAANVSRDASDSSGGGGGSSYRTDGSTPEDYYAFGADVIAIADGTVVTAVDGIPETEMPKPGESRRDFAMRVLDAMWQADPTGRIAGGNYVVIEHGGGEHSFFVHLRNGSVRVRSGDTVKQAQKIAEVGISGDGFQPHLHFAVTNSPSTSYGQGLPVVFTNVRPVPFSSTLDMNERRLFMTGEFVDAIDPNGP